MTHAWMASQKRQRNPWFPWVLAVGISIIVAYPVGLISAVIVTAVGGDAGWIIPAAFIYGICASAVFCALLAISVGPPPRTPDYVIRVAVMGVLAGLAPIGVVVFLRLSMRGCLVMNLLALPWPAPWQDIALWVGAGVWLASTIYLSVALRWPYIQPAAVALWVWSGVISIPAFGFFFLLSYGDPLPGCVPF